MPKIPKTKKKSLLGKLQGNADINKLKEALKKKADEPILPKISAKVKSFRPPETVLRLKNKELRECGKRVGKIMAEKVAKYTNNEDIDQENMGGQGGPMKAVKMLMQLKEKAEISQF